MDSAKPREPGPGECCGSGCARCVWDVYFDEVAKWEESRKQTSTATEELSAPPPSLAFARTEASNNGCASYLGSIVIKYVDGNDIEDDYGVPCMHHSQDPMWRRAMAAAKVSQHPSSSSSLGFVDVTVDESSLSTEQYTPGDTIELFVPNQENDVSMLCTYFGVSEHQRCMIHISPFVAPGCFPPWIPQRCNLSVKDLLTYYIDISSSAYVHKPFLSLLHKCCGAAHSEARASIEALGNDHTLIQRELQTSYPSLLQILQRWSPFLGVIPLAKFLEVSAPLRSRKFSVVQMTHTPTSFLLCARNVLHERPAAASDSARLLAPPAAAGSVFQGHVSSALFASHASQAVWIRNPTFGTSMLSAALVARPLLMLCGGSGVAPALSLVYAAASSHTPSTAAPMSRWLVLSTRSWSDAISVLGASSPAFQVISQQCRDVNVLVTRPDKDGDVFDASLLPCNGRVCTDRIQTLLHREAVEVRRWFHETKAAVVACGPSPFLSSIREALGQVLFPPDAEDDTSMMDHHMRMSELNGDIVFEDWNQRK